MPIQFLLSSADLLVVQPESVSAPLARYLIRPVIRRTFRVERVLLLTRLTSRHETDCKNKLPEGVSAEALKSYLLICIARIFDSRVEGGIPSLAAAPDGPDTRPLASARATQTISRSSIADLLNRDWVAGST